VALLVYLGRSPSINMRTAYLGHGVELQLHIYVRLDCFKRPHQSCGTQAKNIRPGQLPRTCEIPRRFGTAAGALDSQKTWIIKVRATQFLVVCNTASYPAWPSSNLPEMTLCHMADFETL
jgi:hypothetical protein